jgi:arginine decarboxylase
MRPRGITPQRALLALSKESALGKASVLVGNRIPKDFFVTTGAGESDITVHAGSFHLALRDANIEHLNIMKYSSILPSIARQVPFNPRTIPHGAVLETIMAEKSVNKGERATAAIIWGALTDKKTGEHYGGLVCEYSDTGSEQEARESLRASLQELYENGYSEQFDLKEEDIQFHSRSIVPSKKFGTAMVVLGFVNYAVPIIRSAED